MTERMVAAIEHPLVDAIGHPTGRKIETRPPYAIDMERVIEAAARTGTMIEINAAPDRRDMNEIHARAAAAAGVHGAGRLRRPLGRATSSCCAYGIATARRAWLTPEQVANTRPWAEFAPLRKRAARACTSRSRGCGCRANGDELVTAFRAAAGSWTTPWASSTCRCRQTDRGSGES